MKHALDNAEHGIRRTGPILLLGTLLTVLWGVWRGTRRQPGQKAGREPRLLRTPAFYLLLSVGYFGLCYRLWRPLPLALSGAARALALVPGVLFYFPGLALALWGRLALGEMYNVSSSFGAQLYAGHRLVTGGPFAFVRHPMYLGILFTGAGGLLLYRTWTFLFVLSHFPVLVVRARHEEQALAAAFGEQWADYCRRVPAWLPRFMRKQRVI